VKGNAETKRMRNQQKKTHNQTNMHKHRRVIQKTNTSKQLTKHTNRQNNLHITQNNKQTHEQNTTNKQTIHIDIALSS
jgi:hypothetical protein